MWMMTIIGSHAIYEIKAGACIYIFVIINYELPSKLLFYLNVIFIEEIFIWL